MSPWESYVRSEQTTVEGWLSETDGRLFWLAGLAQQDHGVVGDLLEIGVYKGRSAILLGYMKSASEAVVVCDTFGTMAGGYEGEASDNRFYGPTGWLDEFRANWRRFHGDDPEVVVGLSSGDLPARVKGRSFRFVHVDGSHVWSQVVDDIRLVRDVSSSGAIVAFDDIRHGHTPGVAAAVWGAVADEGLVPLVLTDKLYAAWGRTPVTAAFQEKVRQNFRTEEHPIAGGAVLRVFEPPLPRMHGWLRKYAPPVLLPKLKRVRTIVRSARH